MKKSEISSLNLAEFSYNSFSSFSTCWLAKEVYPTLLVESNDKKLFVARIMVFNEFACWQKGFFGLCLAGSEERLFFAHAGTLIIYRKTLKSCQLAVRKRKKPFLGKFGRWALLITATDSIFNIYFITMCNIDTWFTKTVQEWDWKKFTVVHNSC